MPLGELQFDGQYVLDGTGNVTGTETRIVEGTVISFVPISGTYSVAANCRGTMGYKFKGVTVKQNIILVSGGTSFFAIDTDADRVSTAVAHQ